MEYVLLGILIGMVGCVFSKLDNVLSRISRVEHHLALENEMAMSELHKVQSGTPRLVVNNDEGGN